MRIKATHMFRWGWLVMLALGTTCGIPEANAAEMKFEATLVWGANDSKAAEAKGYKPVEAVILKKLHELPLKWTNWFEVRRKSFVGPAGVAQEVSMSEKCQLNVKNLKDPEIEVSLIGKGKEVVKRTQPLPKGEMLVLGGNAPNSTAWLVILKRVE